MGGMAASRRYPVDSRAVRNIHEPVRIRPAQTKTGNICMGKIVHFDTGDAFYGQHSGRHTICACGKSFQDSYEQDKLRYSKDKHLVTCKHCLKTLGKKHR